MKLVSVLLLACIFLLIGCDNSDLNNLESDQPTISPDDPAIFEYFTFTNATMPRIYGSPSMLPLAEAILSVTLNQPRENFTHQERFTRTSNAFRSLISGDADIVFVSEISPSIISEAEANNINMIMAPLATDALVFIVCSSNPVESITSAQVRAIYSGEITNWQELGGDNTPIIPFQRNSEAASQVILNKLVMDGYNLLAAPMQGDSDFAGDITGQIQRGFDAYPGAIGFALLQDIYQAGEIDSVKILSINNIHPSQNTIMSGEYPFLNHYYAIINADEPEDTASRILFNWILSNDGQALITDEGFVSLLNSPDLGYELFPQSSLRWGLATDFSALTPFNPKRNNFDGFADGSLIHFEPSLNHDAILPYFGAVTLEDGSLRVDGYGLVSSDGLVLTSRIYHNIVRAVYECATGLSPRPAYNLQLLISNDDSYFDYSILHSVVALDGSWSTKFEYVNILFSDEVIVLVRDYDSFDIDIIDYNGQHLYNLLDLDLTEKISEIIWPDLFLSLVNEGVSFLPLRDGEVGLLDLSTGSFNRTEFVDALFFSEGLAAVMLDSEDGLWGFVNKDLELVIEPIFLRPTIFRNGLATVITEDNYEHIIDSSGEILFSVSGDYMITTHHDATGFKVTSREIFDDVRFFSKNLVEITYPADINLDEIESAMEFIGNGWYTTLTESGEWIFNESFELLLPPNRYVYEVFDEYIIFTQSAPTLDELHLGVMRLTGDDLIAPSSAASISAILVDNNVMGFILNSTALSTHIQGTQYSPARYTLFNRLGHEIHSDLGFLSFDSATLQLYAIGTNYFARFDINGNELFSIPMLGYSFD